MDETLNKEKVLGIEISTNSESFILEHITKGLENKQKKVFIVTPNPEMLIFAQRHPSFRETLNEASISLPDGIGVVVASKLGKGGIRRRITGVDMLHDLCRELAKQRGIIGLLGGRGQVAEKAADCLVKKYPGLRVGFVGEEPDKLFKLPKSVRIMDVLFVAFGFPKQEEWIHNNLDRIPVKAAMGVGGTFDYLSGKVPRAPVWMRRVGLEWLFRLVVQPWRIKRQLALIQFIGMVLFERAESLFVKK